MSNWYQSLNITGNVRDSSSYDEQYRIIYDQLESDIAGGHPSTADITSINVSSLGGVSFINPMNPTAEMGNTVYVMRYRNSYGQSVFSFYDTNYNLIIPDGERMGLPVARNFGGFVDPGAFVAGGPHPRAGNIEDYIKDRANSGPARKPFRPPERHDRPPPSDLPDDPPDEPKPDEPKPEPEPGPRPPPSDLPDDPPVPSDLPDDPVNPGPRRRRVLPSLEADVVGFLVYGDLFEEEEKLGQIIVGYCTYDEDFGKSKRSSMATAAKAVAATIAEEEIPVVNGRPVTEPNLDDLDYTVSLEKQEEIIEEMDLSTLRDDVAERELMSSRAVLAAISYQDLDERPDSVFGLDYVSEDSDEETAVYYSAEQNRLVISYRGTVPGFTRDVLSDLLIVLGYHNKFSFRFKEALKKTVELAAKYPDAQITIVGHSLGGAITEHVVDNLPLDVKGRTRGWGFATGKGAKSGPKKSVSWAADMAAAFPAFSEAWNQRRWDLLPHVRDIMRHVDVGEAGRSADALTNIESIIDLGDRFGPETLNISRDELETLRVFSGDISGLPDEMLEGGESPAQLASQIQDIVSDRSIEDVVESYTENWAHADTSELLRNQIGWIREGVSDEVYNQRTTDFLSSLSQEQLRNVARDIQADRSISLASSAVNFVKSFVKWWFLKQLGDFLFGLVYLGKGEDEPYSDSAMKKLFLDDKREFVTYRFDSDPLSVHHSILYNVDTDHLRTVHSKDSEFGKSSGNDFLGLPWYHGIDNFILPPHKGLKHKKIDSKRIEK